MSESKIQDLVGISHLLDGAQPNDSTSLFLLGVSLSVLSSLADEYGEREFSKHFVEQRNFLRLEALKALETEKASQEQAKS